jgi:hypothetical protein
MFTINATKLDQDRNPQASVILRSGFSERQDAKLYIEKYIKRNAPHSGWNAEQDYWWTRRDGTVTRYTIVADATSI